MTRAIIVIVIIATFIGAMMPGRSKSAAEAEPAPKARPWFDEDGGSSTSAGGSQGWGSSSSSGSGSSSSSASEVRLTRRANGHFYADVAVNGTIVEFMIDTGATGIAMTERDARRANVDLDRSERTYVGEGAGGALSGQIVQLESVKLGSRNARDMGAVVIDGASTNLLGQSFLSQFAEVTVRGDVMTLR